MEKLYYGKTLNLPQTDFPMRGNLPKKEPEILGKWEEMDIYKRSKKPIKAIRNLCYDGPPYANGDIHLGHTLNKILKDIIVKYHSQRGYDAPYVPGWDTHGLPIELRAIQDLNLNRKEIDLVKFREYCRDYALKYIGIQRNNLKDWELEGLG